MRTLFIQSSSNNPSSSNPSLDNQPFNNQSLHDQSLNDRTLHKDSAIFHNAQLHQDRTLHDQFQAYGKNAKQWLRKCALLLPEIERRKIWKQRGFESIHVYAAKLAGMSRSSVDEALRVLKKVEDKPALKRVIQEKGIQAVRPVIAIATPETEAFWAGKARQMTKNTLETYVKEYKKDYSKNSFKKFPREENQLQNESINESIKNLKNPEIFPSTPPSPPSPTQAITMHLTPDLAAELETLKGGDDWNTLMQELLDLRKKTLEQQKPKPVKTESRHIPENIKRFILAKTRSHCVYPNCTKPYDILHHLDRFALTKTHDPDRIVPLCTAHERLAHHSLIANEETNPLENRFTENRQPKTWHILEKPIWWDQKYMIDQKVMAYRKRD